MIRLVIEYDSINGEVVPDGKVYSHVNDIISTSKNENISSPIIIMVGSVVLFDAFRVAVKEKRIDNRDVIIHFKEKDYELDTEGKISNWPEGLCDIYDEILDKLISNELMPRDSSIR